MTKGVRYATIFFSIIQGTLSDGGPRATRLDYRVHTLFFFHCWVIWVKKEGGGPCSIAGQDHHTDMKSGAPQGTRTWIMRRFIRGPSLFNTGISLILGLIHIRLLFATFRSIDLISPSGVVAGGSSNRRPHR